LASAITHSAFAIALGTAFHARLRPLRFWLLGAACAAAPDLDVIGLRLGIPYEAPLGHRGASHSLFFAAVLAAALAPVARSPSEGIQLARAWCFLFLATASHGVLDAFTDRGGGIGFFWPFDYTRYAFPFRPLKVSPLRIGAFFSARGLGILLNEILWVWVPAAVLSAAFLRWRLRPRQARQRPLPR
jgi:inner membrane protein